MYANFSQLIDDIAQEVAKWSTADLSARFAAEDVPHGIVLTPAEIINDPQVKASEIIRIIEDPVAGPMRLVARNARFSNHPPNPIRPAPALGSGNAAIGQEFELPL
tara:strand:- start:311 stop:628 length:318 start_codon:yes stop_codon:yes gene_type:complete